MVILKRAKKDRHGSSRMMTVSINGIKLKKKKTVNYKKDWTNIFVMQIL